MLKSERKCEILHIVNLSMIKLTLLSSGGTCSSHILSIAVGTQVGEHVNNN